jgi:hypothetical protein
MSSPVQPAPKAAAAPGAPLVKIAEKKAAALARDAELSKDARKLLGADSAPQPFIEELLAAELFEDVILLLAQGLPKREAVWWACLCLWRLCGMRPKAEEKPLLQSAVGWVVEPDEDKRRAAQAQAEKADPKLPARWLGLAVAADGQGGTSLVPGYVAGSILLAAAGADVANLPDLEHHCADVGLQVATGKCRVPEAPKPQAGQEKH